MVQVIHQGLISPGDAVKSLKPYLRSNMPAVILKILSVRLCWNLLRLSDVGVEIVDALILNCGETIHATMLLDRWHSRLSRLTAHADNKVKQAALQLISNYAQSYR